MANGFLSYNDFLQNAKSGFFVDQQLACDSLCWTLYAQPVAKVDARPNENAPYSEILLRGIINDESPAVKFSVKHKYHDAGTGPLGSIVSAVTDTVKGAWSGMRQFQAGFNALTSGIKGSVPSNTKAGKWISDISNKATELRDEGISVLDGMTSGKASEFLNMSRGSLMLGTDGLKYYNGSDIEITTPDIKFRYYHGMYRRSDGTPISVRELITELNNRLIGKFQGSNTPGGGSTIGVMNPPNGLFSSGINVLGLNEDNRIQGTFCLEYSGRRIPNLICNRYDVELSTTKVLDYEDGYVDYESTELGRKRLEEVDGKLVTTRHFNPLYADITISLESAAIYTRDNINSVMAN